MSKLDNISKHSSCEMPELLSALLWLLNKGPQLLIANIFKHKLHEQ